MKHRTLPVNNSGVIIGYMIQCPACGNGHLFYTSNWSFDGDVEYPTFNPSMLVHANKTGDQKRCHSFVREGKIQYLNDCGHDMKGQTVDLPVLHEDVYICANCKSEFVDVGDDHWVECPFCQCQTGHKVKEGN